MDFLFDPNFAYMLLVIGFVLLLLALITPGTGLLEIGALFCGTLAGIAIYRNGFNLWALVILVLALIPYIYAIRRPKQTWTLVVSIVAIIAGSVYLFPGQGLAPAVNPILASVLSLMAAGFIWFVVRKTAAAHTARPNHDLGALVGQVGEAKTSIHESGSVQVAGELWTARSPKHIPAGAPVRVVGREGLILTVEKA